MHPTIVIGATHLKGRFKGTLFVTVCKDTNEYVYLVAFSIGHVEDEDSWTWFLSKLCDAFGCPKNTMFISDQHLDIKKAIQNADPEAHHGLCGYHLKKNFKNKFKRDDLSMLFTLLEITISKCKREAIKFYADYYKTTVLVEGYSGSVHPVGNPSEWDIPPHVKQIVVLPPPW
ncbi:MULE transposase domain - like 4 [Theobroma cacao]|nr:MULE transposase domain - like 4 [Theobroma cacao]